LALVADTARLDNMQSASTQRPAIEQALQGIRLIRDTWNGIETALAKAAKALDK
jgi:hypothetical protein